MTTARSPACSTCCTVTSAPRCASIPRSRGSAQGLCLRTGTQRLRRRPGAPVRGRAVLEHAASAYRHPPARRRLRVGGARHDGRTRVHREMIDSDKVLVLDVDGTLCPTKAAHQEYRSSCPTRRCSSGCAGIATRVTASSFKPRARCGPTPATSGESTHDAAGSRGVAEATRRPTRRGSRRQDVGRPRRLLC